MKRAKFKDTEIGMIPEDWKDGDLFLKTMREFLDQEKFILKNDLNERTISHKLAEYLKKSFEKYDVDCEYNKMQSGKIDKRYVHKTLNLDTESLESDSADGITVYPDIILHHRGDNPDNYIVIEIKKKSFANQKRKNSDETYRDFDMRKLNAYIKELNYKFGIYIEFDSNNISQLVFFIHG